jgi:hypothetical protein
MGAEVNVILRVSKAAWAIGFHEKGLSLQVRVVNGVCDLGVAFDKPSIEVGKPQEALNVLDRGWSSPTLDGLDL